VEAEGRNELERRVMPRFTMEINMKTKHNFESRDDWYEALKTIAAKHDNVRAVRDREGWTDNWRNQTPEFAYLR
jgi:hypothetical protein